MKSPGKLIAGVVVGAGAMYLLDPERGAERRALLRKEGVGPGSRKDWTPAARVLVGTAGGLILLKGAKSGGAKGKALRAVGAGLLARASSSVRSRRLVGLAKIGPAIDVEKTIAVAAPLEQVWELWSNFENFPRFMAHLREVRKIDEGHSHWVAVGPAGVSVEWDAEVTDWVPEQFIGWASVEGSSIGTSGQVRFRPLGRTQTEIDVQLTYHPPAGAAGHALAVLAGVDPKQAMDEDLLRLKSLLENESTRGDQETGHLAEPLGKGKSARSRKGSAARRRKS
jgi:uncharacterized membrane protein